VFFERRISGYDPNERGLSKFRRTLQRVFPERHLIVRTEQGMWSLNFSTIRQLLVALVLVVSGGWLLLSSGLVINHGEELRAKNLEITDARSGYEQLLAQLSTYTQKISGVTASLYANYEHTVSLIERQKELTDRKTRDGALALAARQRKPDRGSEDVDPFWTTDPTKLDLAIGRTELERARSIEEGNALKQRLNELGDGMVDLAKVHQGAISVDLDSVKLREVMLERDLAVAQSVNLNSRVQELETELGDMESTQLLLFAKFSELADTRIDQIQTSLEGTGLGLDELLGQREKRQGMGGPFILASVVQEVGGPLRKSLDLLNIKVERWNDLRSLIDAMPLDKPLEQYWISSGFGPRKDPFNGGMALHQGLDLGGAYNSPVLSPGEGKVTHAGWQGLYGRLVEIDHGMGLTSRYGHLQKIIVRVGDHVGRGTKLGLLGSSGRSTSPHLHYEIRYNGKPLNPLKFIRAGDNVLKG